MRRLPGILVIDDDYGKEGKERDNFCLRTGLKDPHSRINVENPLAEAIFCRGQVERSGKVINDLEGTLKIIEQGWQRSPRWALVLLDLHFDTGDLAERDPQHYFGLKILREMHHRQDFRDIPVIILSSMDRQAIEREFADHGALGFVDKANLNKHKLQELLFHHGLMEPPDTGFIGRSNEFLKCLKEARKRAHMKDGNILILGENGTGKELLAEYIHRQSGRTGEFKLLFTQGVPENLIEDLLFGHVKGAFTGAGSEREGAAEQADKGTLFIDEFGNIPASIQSKLLRLLDKKIREVQRLGSTQPKKLDLLVVMATNKLDILTSNDFRKDLLYRVNAANPILLPPLRERKEDILPLAELFIKKFEKDFSAQSRNISNEAGETLLKYHWPGNIRELENVIESAVYSYPELKVLSTNHLIIKEETGRTVQMQTPPGPREETGISADITPIQNLDSLLEALDRFDFKHLRREELKGKLPRIQDAFARCIARYLNVTLKSTLSYTSQNPEGEISYHRAIKLMSGDFNMKATPAKRLLNSLLKISPGALLDLWKSEPLVKDAMERFGDDRLKAELEKLAAQEEK
jgi:transcriptional regulator with GAF, ATPase, and Fis domain